ncbi:MAG TPA: DUF1543 domain-containing protein, partial [Flavisolibacter sp.]|nr:DUF1543 domain-containing protein [Flavisolibacter sp.]
HYKMIVAARDKGEAIQQARRTAFFRHTGFKGAEAHVDNKYGVDVDDSHAIRDILPQSAKERFSLQIEPVAGPHTEDEIHLGYFRLDKADQWAPNEAG